MTHHFWLRIVVFEYRLTTLDYFLYRMQPSELRMIAENIRFTYRPQWDIARTLALFLCAPYTKKKLKIRDLFPLPWDHDNDVVMDAEQLKRHSEEMQKIAEAMTKNFINRNSNEDNVQGQGTGTEMGVPTDDSVRETDWQDVQGREP